MSIAKMAFRNFRTNFRNYFCLILSLAFAILTLLNFLNIIYTDAFISMGEQNQDKIKSVIGVISFVLGCFMFFFIWYSTNVFLTKRKKEIGIYIFMGLTNQRIGQMYMLETIMTGVSALALGIGAGSIVSRLFLMVFAAVSDIEVDIVYQFAVKPAVVTGIVFISMYLIFAAKGYINIVRSSVLEMLSASRKNEYSQVGSWILIVKTIFGVLVLSTGYYLAVKEGGYEVLNNIMAAVVLVTAGIYLIFGGMLPFLFRRLADNKRLLYRRERALWVNQVVFRMKKNYRTYAMTCVLMLCAVTALATGFAMRERYENLIAFKNTYTFQILRNVPGMQEEGARLIEKDNEIVYQTYTPFLLLDSSLIDTPYQNVMYALLPYSFIETLAADAGMEFSLERPADDEIIAVEKVILMSLYTDRSYRTMTINKKKYVESAETRIPYLGGMQENFSFYIVNDEEYERLRPLGMEFYTCNYKIADIYNYEVSRDELKSIRHNTEESYTEIISVNPSSNQEEWIKTLYATALFMFVVFMLAGISVLFMKLYNDAFEEKERYAVLQKLGIDKGTLGRAISCELCTAYLCPFVITAVSSYFSVSALEKLMTAELKIINVVSVLVILVFFLIFYLVSAALYKKNACGGRNPVRS